MADGCRCRSDGPGSGPGLGFHVWPSGPRLPAAARTCTFAGVIANEQPGVPTTMSQHATMSQAPPHTPPSTAAITGTEHRRISCSSCTNGSLRLSGSLKRPLPLCAVVPLDRSNSRMSWPALQTATPGCARRITTRTPAAMHRSKPLVISAHSRAPSALRFRSCVIVTVPTSSLMTTLQSGSVGASSAAGAAGAESDGARPASLCARR
eukprot:5265723-Prymnesium_polylepis.1